MTHPDRDDKPIDEVGILEDVMISDLIDNKVFMFMQQMEFSCEENDLLPLAIVLPQKTVGTTPRPRF
jgi:hypothetical protein